MTRGFLIVISGPAGSGKGTVVKHILKENNNFTCSISATTRQKRFNEIENQSYFFITEEEFIAKIKNDEMLEYTQYIGNYYGTPKNYVEEMLEQGKNVILEIEVNGAMQILNKIPDAVLIFFSPPTINELEKRLRARGTEDEATIQKRMSRSLSEIKYIDDYNYLVINNEGNIQKAADEIIAIVKAEQCKRRREVYIEKFLKNYTE
ncbi:guanylate kinase [Eubacteriales bacterium OttesenSCG-928-G02]|nr:guanylate kinase [Eubacteriales bacterium OttesenSCG-928-G02]